MNGGPVLLYDGQCGFCNSTIQWILRHDPNGSLRFAPLEGAFGGALRVRHPELATIDSLIWVVSSGSDTPARLSTRSDAALQVARYLGGRWRLAGLLTIIPRPLRDAVYDLIAKHRHRLSRGGIECVLPTAAQRARFLLDGADA
jgi:predicted DCC family thiol-disulfide oxidoreductase YuxK